MRGAEKLDWKGLKQFTPQRFWNPPSTRQRTTTQKFQNTGRITSYFHSPDLAPPYLQYPFESLRDAIRGHKLGSDDDVKWPRVQNSNWYKKVSFSLALSYWRQWKLFRKIRCVIHGDQKVSVHLMITIQKVTSNVQSVPRQSPDSIDTPNCVLEDRVQYSTVHVIMVSDWNCLKYFCVFFVL
jgi:hypothetical protein